MVMMTDIGDAQIDPLLATLPSPEAVMAEAEQRFLGMIHPSPHTTTPQQMSAYHRAVLSYVQSHPATVMRCKLLAVRCPSFVIEGK
jgi:hypothetical protein